MRKQANRWLVAVFLLFFIFSGIHMTAFGEEPAKDPLAQLEEEMGIGEEIQRIQEYLDGLRPEGRTVSLTDLMQVIIQGNMKEIVNTAGKLLEDALFSQAKEGQALLVQVAVLGLTGAVFSHAASAFKGSQIPETAFYMIYLLIFTCLAVQYPDHSPGIRPDPGVCPSAYAGLFYQRGLCRGKYQCCGFL